MGRRAAAADRHKAETVKAYGVEHLIGDHVALSTRKRMVREGICMAGLSEPDVESMSGRGSRSDRSLRF